MHTLLLIDDNAAVQRMVELAFHHEAISIVIARSVEDAVRQIAESPPNIILADEAFSISPFLKSDPLLAGIPVVMLRGAFGPIDATGDRVEVLKKPIHPELLLNRVKLMLGLPQMRSGMDAPPASPAPAVTMDHGLPLDEYFDQLAAAFSKVNAPAPPAEPHEENWPFPVQPAKSQEVKPALRQALPEAAVAVSDELVDRIAQRVIDRMGDKMVRATVTEVVSRLAKWLVADELEKVEKKAKAR